MSPALLMSNTEDEVIPGGNGSWVITPFCHTKDRNPPLLEPATTVLLLITYATDAPPLPASEPRSL